MCQSLLKALSSLLHAFFRLLGVDRDLGRAVDGCSSSGRWRVLDHRQAVAHACLNMFWG